MEIDDVFDATIVSALTNASICLRIFTFISLSLYLEVFARRLDHDISRFESFQTRRSADSCECRLLLGFRQFIFFDHSPETGLDRLKAFFDRGIAASIRMTLRPAVAAIRVKPGCRYRSERRFET